MSTSEGAIRAELSLGLEQFQAQINQALALTDKLGAGLKAIPTVTPKVDTSQLERQAGAATTTTKALGESLKGIPSPKLNLDAGGLERGAQQSSNALKILLAELRPIPGVGGLAQSSLLGVGQSGIQMGTALAGGAAAGVVALSGAMAAATKIAVDFEAQIAQVRSIKLDLDVRAATDSIRTLAAQVGQSAESLSKGLYDIFSSLSISQGQAVDLLEVFAKGAVAAVTDVRTFGTAIAGILNAYKIDFSEATRVSDIFFNVVRDGVITGEQLAHSLGPVTASAKNAGVSLEELGALLVGVTKEGGDAAQNVNNLNNLLAKLVTKETTQQFKDLGISVADASGKLRSPIAVLTDLKARFEGLTEAQKANALQEIFPDLQARQAVQVLLSQLDTVKTALIGNQAASGSTAAAYETMAATSKAALERLQQSVAGLAGTFGDSLIPSMTAVVLKAGDVVKGFSDAGRAIDDWLASPGVRAATELLLKLQNAPSAPRPITGPPPVAGQLQEQGALTRGDVAPFAGKAFGQRARGVAVTKEDIDAQAAAIAQNRERVAAEDAAAASAAALDARTTQLDQDSREYAQGLRDLKAAQDAARDAMTLAATAQERLAAGLAAGIGQQVEWNAEIAKALDPAKNLSNVSGTDLVQGILKAKQATEESAKAFEIHDLAIAAEVIRLRDLAAKTKDVAEAQALQKQANDLAGAALDAQAKGAAAAAASATALAKPYDDLASSILPALTAKQAEHIAVTKATEDSVAALAEAAKAAGIDLAQYGDLTALTGQQLAEVKAQVDAAAKGFAGFLKDEDKSRITSVLGALASGTSDVVAAQAKQLEASGQTEQALKLLASQYGVSAEQARAWADALKQGGPAAELAKVQMQGLTAATGEAGKALFEARERLAALTTFARDQAGNIRLKVDIDIEAAQKSLGDLQRDFQEANRKRAEAEAKATREFNESQAAAIQARSQTAADFARSMGDIERARSDATAQLGRDLSKAASAQNDALSKVSRARDDAALKYAKAVEDANDKLAQSAKDIGTRFGEGLVNLQERAQQALESFATSQASALKSLSAAQTTYNQQQVQNAFDASVAAQNDQLKTLTDTGVFGSISNADRVRQIQEEGRRGLAQTGQAEQLEKARASAQQQVVDSQKALTKSLDDVQKEMVKLNQNFRESLAKAQSDYARAIRDANDALEKANRDTAAQESEANAQASDSQRDAIEENAKKQRDLNDKATEAQQKFFDQMAKEGFERANDPERKGRTKAEQAFDEAEAKRREEQREADKQFQRAQKQASDQLAALVALKASIDRVPADTAQAIAARVKVGEQNFLSGSQITNVETQVDFLSEAIGEFARQTRGN